MNTPSLNSAVHNAGHAAFGFPQQLRRLIQVIWFLIGTEATLRVIFFGSLTALLLAPLLPEPFYSILTLLGLSFLLFLLSISAPMRFRMLLSNRRTVTLPGIRHQALLGLLSVVVLQTLLMMYAMFMLNQSTGINGVAVDVSWIGAWTFCAASLLVLLVQWLLSHARLMTASLIMSVLFIGSMQKYKLNQALISGTLEWFLPLGLLITAIAWLACWLWLQKAQYIKPSLAGSGRFQAAPQFDLSRLRNAFGNPALTLMRNIDDSWRSRLIGVVGTTLFLPALMTLLLLIIDQQASWQKPDLGKSFMFMGLYPLLLFAMGAAERLARTRLLWLRVAGSRRQLGLLWERDAIRSVGLLTGVVGGYLLLAAQIWPASAALAKNLFVFAIGFGAASYYLNTMLGAYGWSMIFRSLASAALLIGLTAVIMVPDHLPMLAIWSIALTLSAVVVLLSRHLLFRRIEQLDWMVLKPNQEPATRSWPVWF